MLLLCSAVQRPLGSPESSCQSLGGQPGELGVSRERESPSGNPSAPQPESPRFTHPPTHRLCPAEMLRGSARAWHWEPPCTERSYSRQGV